VFDVVHKQIQKLAQEVAERKRLLEICKDELAAGQEKHDDLIDQIEKLTDNNRSLEAKIISSQEETMEAKNLLEVNQTYIVHILNIFVYFSPRKTL
jgi:septal ring factor EnvC (AmiA/AmiB activator)